MDWGVVLEEWQTVLGACGITWIVTQYFSGKLHQRALDEQHKFDVDRIIQQRIKLVYALKSRLACELFERDTNLYISALKSLSVDVARVLSEGDIAVERRIETLEEEARQEDLIEGPSMRETVSVKEEFSMWSDDSLLSRYLVISSLYFLYGRKPVPDSNLSWALEKAQERADANLLWRIKRAKAEYEAFESTICQIGNTNEELASKVDDIIFKHSPILYEGSDFIVYQVPHPSSLTRATGFAFAGPTEFSVVEEFAGGTLLTTFYRSDPSFENLEELRNQVGTTITFADRRDNS